MYFETDNLYFRHQPVVGPQTGAREMPVMPYGEMPVMPYGEMPVMPYGEMPVMPYGEMLPQGEMLVTPYGEISVMPQGEMPVMVAGSTEQGWQLTIDPQTGQEVQPSMELTPAQVQQQSQAIIQAFQQSQQGSQQAMLLAPSLTEVTQENQYMVFRTKLFTLPFDVPEVKMAWGRCSGWTWGPCWPKVWEKCKIRASVPCWKKMTRTAKYSYELVLRVPINIAGNYRAQIQKCHDNAFGLARDFVYRAAAAGAAGAIFSLNPLQAPVAAVREAALALRPAARWYFEMMKHCVENIYEGFGNQLMRGTAAIKPIIERTDWR